MSEATHVPADKAKSSRPHLPVSKCKRIAKTDPDCILTSQAAYVATAFATELFIQNFVEEAMLVSQLEKNNAKSVRLTYDNLAKCVSRLDKFMFLGDVVPLTKNLKTLVQENRARYTTTAADPGQTVLPFKMKDQVQNQEDITLTGHDEEGEGTENTGDPEKDTEDEVVEAGQEDDEDVAMD